MSLPSTSPITAPNSLFASNQQKNFPSTPTGGFDGQFVRNCKQVRTSVGMSIAHKVFYLASFNKFEAEF
jgi:hypothetical protein